ncbi:MAG TPA: hypothetical protein VGP93_05820 [Polyangiaceae bacterium]|nr:hypothetical protein [Polyangiaceae bacterium]
MPEHGSASTAWLALTLCAGLQGGFGCRASSTDGEAQPHAAPAGMTFERPGATTTALPAPEEVASVSPAVLEVDDAADGGTDAEASAAELAPLALDSDLIDLEVPGFAPAIVSAPRGAREARPLVVALHGNFDRPEWQCEVWRAATQGYPFILCPRGVPRRDAPKSLDRWEYSLAKVEVELDRGVAALRERFPQYVVDGPIVYVGFSLGAMLGVSIVKKSPARYPRALLIEGGLGGLTAGSAVRFHEQGGERLLLACGQTECARRSRALLKVLEQKGVGAHLVDGGNIGHTYDGAIAEGVAREWRWLVEGLPGWAASGPNPDAGAPASPDVGGVVAPGTPAKDL